MSKKQIKNLVRILVTALIIAVLFAAPVTGVIRLIMWMAAYLIIGYDILIKAFKGIKNRQPLDENLLMSIATVGAIALALYDKSGDYSEAVAVMLFYQIGEWFQGYAVGKSRKNISELMDIVPDYYLTMPILRLRTAGSNRSTLMKLRSGRLFWSSPERRYLSMESWLMEILPWTPPP